MKSIIFGIIAAAALSISVALYANNSAKTTCNHSETEVSMAGNGACTYTNCKCPKFNQRPGYYQCWCGHQSFMHK